MYTPTEETSTGEVLNLDVGQKLFTGPPRRFPAHTPTEETSTGEVLRGVRSPRGGTNVIGHVSTLEASQHGCLRETSARRSEVSRSHYDGFNEGTLVLSIKESLPP